MPSQIIILGMHRSGTSLAGQVLEALGFHFGPESQAAAPKKDNPLGYWERKDVGALNDRALAHLGATWEQVGTWQAGDLTPAHREDFDVTARRIIAEYPEGKPWFMKDPRMCITLPLWEKHLTDPVYLFIYRDPVEIARSLWTRNRYTPRLVTALWERYLGDALNMTRGKRRVLLRYADLLQNTEGALVNLVEQLKQVGAEPTCTVESALKKIKVDGSLRHHQRDGANLEIPLTASQELLNRQVRDGTAFTLPGPVDVSGANLRIIASQQIAMTGSAENFSLQSWEALPAPGREAMEALEIIQLLGYHLASSKVKSDAWADHTALTLFRWCEALADGNFVQSRYRKTRRLLLDHEAEPPKTLIRSISRSPAPFGQQWSKSLHAAGEAVETLFGAYVLGKIPLNLCEGSPQSQSHAIEIEALLRQTLKAVQNAVNCLKQTLSMLPKSDTPCPDYQDDAAKLLQWGIQLSSRWPFGASKSKAVAEFESFRQRNASYATKDSERLEFFLPILEVSAYHVNALLEGFSRTEHLP